MSDKGKYEKLAKDICIFIVGMVLTKAIQFILMPLYTTYMSTEAYGTAELINSLSELLYPVVTLCVYEAAFRFAVDTNYDNINLATSVTKLLIVSFVIGGCIAIAGKLLFGYENSLYLFAVLYAYAIRTCAAFFVRGCGYSKVFAFSGVINAIALAVFNIFFLIFLKKNVEGYLISIALAYCISTLYLVLAGGIYKKIKLNGHRMSSICFLLKYSAPLIPYNILYWVTTISGRYILQYYTDVATVGLYVAAIKIATVINMIQNAVYSAFQLNSSRQYESKQKEEYYNNVNNGLTAVYFIFGSLTICLTPILAKLTLKNEFINAGQYLPIIMFSAIINCISSLVGTMYTTYKATKKMVPISVLGAGVNVITGCIFTPMVGIWGICLASALSYFAQVLYKMMDTQKSFKLKYNWRVFMIDVVLLTFQIIVASQNNHILTMSTMVVTMIIIGINCWFYRDVIQLVLERIKLVKRNKER